jgi:hypothetical protein
MKHNVQSVYAVGRDCFPRRTGGEFLEGHYPVRHEVTLDACKQKRTKLVGSICRPWQYTTPTQTDSPSTGSDTPTASAFETEGCAVTACSTSTGEIHAATHNDLFDRPSISSALFASPCDIARSKVSSLNDFSVRSTRRRYPRMRNGVRISSSPGSPSTTTEPSTVVRRNRTPESDIRRSRLRPAAHEVQG